jgi:excisionase family DNA binding protein
MITVSEAAERIGVHPATMKRWEHAGLITARRTPGGHRRFAPADVERLLTQPLKDSATVAAEGGPECTE